MAKETQAQRLRRLEEIIQLVLVALLRGHLLPSERRTVKRYLQETKKQTRIEEPPATLRCPACRSPLQSEHLVRCPWCQVILSGLHLKRKPSRKKTRTVSAHRSDGHQDA